MSSRKRYPAERRERAVRMFEEILDQHPSECGGWVRQTQVDDGARAGIGSEESAELRRLRREKTRFVTEHQGRRESGGL